MIFLSAGSFLSEHPITVGLAIVAAIVWTVGNYLKKKWLIGVGIGLTVLALLTFTGVFNFVTQL